MRPRRSMRTASRLLCTTSFGAKACPKFLGAQAVHERSRPKLPARGNVFDAIGDVTRQFVERGLEGRGCSESSQRGKHKLLAPAQRKRQPGQGDASLIREPDSCFRDFDFRRRARVLPRVAELAHEVDESRITANRIEQRALRVPAVSRTTLRYSENPELLRICRRTGA